MTDRTKIWYLIGELAMGGTEKTLVDLVTELDSNRYTVTIWTIKEPGPLAREVPDHVSIKSLSAAGKGDPRVPIRFIRALRNEQPTILQSFLYHDNILARIAGGFAPDTTIITGVRMVPDSMPPQRNIIDRATISLSDFIVSNSQAGADWAIERGAPTEKVKVVHNGRDTEKYDVPPSDEVRDSIGIGSGPVVGTVGRLVRVKGHRELLDAWPDVLEIHPDAELVVVGEGPERDVLEEQIQELNIGASVHLLGQRDDVPEILALFDVFAFPSHVEGLPGALLEAMCAGLPIVTTPVGGNTELVSDHEHGIHIPAGDSEALASALHRLLADKDLATTLSKNAKERAKREFSIGAMVEGFESIYRVSQ